LGEIGEAIEYCNSILRQPAKSLTDLTTRAYLTVLIACIDEKSDNGTQLKKARKLWQRIKKEHDNARSISSEAREISKKDTDMTWQGIMDSLDETEEYFKEQIDVSYICLFFSLEITLTTSHYSEWS